MTNKILHITLLLLFAYLTTINATTYYVATVGNDSNDGKSENTSWQTIKYAASQVQAGDTVFVKAGSYNGERVSFVNSGTDGNPIVIEGYKETVGDILNIDWWTYGASLNPTEMPLIDGGNRASGTAIQILSGGNILLKNIQITNYSEGIIIYSDGVVLENIIATTFGKESSNGDSYYGTGISINGDNNKAKNCAVLNAGAEGISIVGASNVLDGCKVYCDEGYSGQPNVNVATDYYIVLAGDNNLLKDCYIERVGDLDHGGAGIGIKSYGQNNIFEDCTAKNLRNAAFYVRHRGVKNNTFNNCTAFGGISGDGFIIRDGASNNTFNYCRTDRCTLAIAFYDAEEDGINSAGRYNNFNNCIFENTRHSIIAFAGQNKNSMAEFNNFVNCVFISGENLFNTGRKNENNEMINCVVSGVKNYKYVKYTNYREVHFKFTNTDFWNMGFDIPYNENSTYTNILKVNPRFVDANNSDYHLEYNSQLIDAGLADMSAYNLPELDYYGNPRFFDSKESGTATIDIGVHEFQSITDVEYKIITPTKFVLFNNYPNPFNPTTNISYNLSNSADVKISIYNSMGQLLEVLYNNFQTQGKHTIKWNASNVSSGVYFYKVEAGTSVAVKRCLLIK